MNSGAKICLLKRFFSTTLPHNIPPTIILRHRKENLKKCSLRGLEKKEDFIFLKYPRKELPCLTNYFVLAMDGPPISEEDREKGLLLIDGTWRYAEKMLSSVTHVEKRSLPKQYVTAYPRKQTDCPDPKTGLASIEALYLAFVFLKRDLSGLLDNYHWKDEFKQINKL